MKTIRSLEEIKANNDQRQKADVSYRLLVREVSDFVRAYVFSRSQLSFNPSETLTNEIEGIPPKLKEMITNGFVDIEMAKDVKSRFTRVKTQMRKEWALHYSSYTPTIETLHVIEGIDADMVDKCLSDIQETETWTTNCSALERLSKALSESKSLIGELELDDDIIKFLQKMTSGEARVSDLNYDLILWMKKEGIEDKVRLSFASTT
jgi:hypothetical protein